MRRGARARTYGLLRLMSPTSGGAFRRDGGWLRCCHRSLHLTLRVRGSSGRLAERLGGSGVRARLSDSRSVTSPGGRAPRGPTAAPFGASAEESVSSK